MVQLSYVTVNQDAKSNGVRGTKAVQSKYKAPSGSGGKRRESERLAEKRFNGGGGTRGGSRRQCQARTSLWAPTPSNSPDLFSSVIIITVLLLLVGSHLVRTSDPNQGATSIESSRVESSRCFAVVSSLMSVLADIA